MEELLARQKTLMLSTLTSNHSPFISYAPYIMRGHDIYIYISQTAEHYHNLVAVSYTHLTLPTTPYV